MQAGRVALALSALIFIAWPTWAQTAQSAPPTPAVWQPKTQAEFEAAVKKGVNDSQDSYNERFQATVQAAIVAATHQLDKERATVVIIPTGRCDQPDVRYYKPKDPVNANDIEQAVTQNLSCCLQDDYENAMTCIDRDVQWLAWAHNVQARKGQKFYFGETYLTAAAGSAAAVLEFANGDEDVVKGLVVLALAPVINEQLGGYGARSQVHYAASHAFPVLTTHYRRLGRHLTKLPNPTKDHEALAGDCGKVASLKDITDAAHPADARVVNAEIARFKTYCDAFRASLAGVRAYRLRMQSSYDDLPGMYANDALALEGVFHKMSFSLQAPPSSALQTVITAPFGALTNAIMKGSVFEQSKAATVTFALEKDGLTLSGAWPDIKAPPAFASPPIRIDSEAEASRKKLTGTAAAEAGQAMAAMREVQDALNVENEVLLVANDQLNTNVANLVANGGTYKMVFDLRSEKRTAAIEFDRFKDKE